MEGGRNCWGLQRRWRALGWSWQLTQAAQMPPLVHMPWVHSRCLAQATAFSMMSLGSSLLPSYLAPDFERAMCSAHAEIRLQTVVSVKQEMRSMP